MEFTKGTYCLKDNWLFHLTSPEYETEIFGYRMGELRLLTNTNVTDYILMDNIRWYLREEEFLACTFRGDEDIKLVRYLNDLGFLFVGTYSIVHCNQKDFQPISIRTDVQVIEAESNDYEDMINIKSRVFDYSTHQLDPLFCSKITSVRNVRRLKSYFDNPNHCAYVIKHQDKVIGYLQFVVDLENKKALCTNGAVDPDFHAIFVGAKLYSDAFNNIFNLGVDTITSGYCNQNVPAMKLHQSLNFKLTKHEIHLRLHIW